MINKLLTSNKVMSSVIELSGITASDINKLVIVLTVEEIPTAVITNPDGESSVALTVNQYEFYNELTKLLNIVQEPYVAMSVTIEPDELVLIQYTRYIYTK